MHPALKLVGGAGERGESRGVSVIERLATRATDPVAFAEALARVACSGGGPKALAGCLASAIDAAVLVEDAEWRFVALAGSHNRTVPPTVRDLVAAGRRNGGGTVILDGAGEPPALAMKMHVGDAVLGSIAAFPAAPLQPEATALLRLTAAAIAVEMTRERGASRHRRRSFWERLLSNAYDDPIEARDDASSRGIALAPAYVAVCVEAEGLEEGSASAKQAELRRICAETLRTPGGEVVALERGPALVFLCPVPLEVDAANARTAATLIPRAAAKAHFGAKIVGGVGRPAEAANAARSLEDARDAVFIARRLFGGSRVMPYDELGAYPLLLRGGASKEDLHRFADRALQPLRAYDERHQTELVKTLRLYFDVGQNVKTAAAQLSVHRHTIFYRLRQIAEIGGYALDSAHDQLTLRTAMAIEALTGS